MEAAAEGGRLVDKFPNRIGYHFPFPLEESQRGAIRDSYMVALEELGQLPRMEGEVGILAMRLRRSLAIRVELLTKNTDHLRPLNHTDISPLLRGIDDFAGEGHFKYDTAADFEAGISRARSWLEWVDTAIEYMELGIERRESQPRAVVAATIQTLDALLENKEELLFRLIRPTLQPPPIDFASLATRTPKPHPDREAYRQKYKLAMKEVIQGYEKLLEYLINEHLPRSRSDTQPGLCYIENGKDQYERILEYWLGEKADPRKLFDYAENTYKKAEAELLEIAQELGYLDDNSHADIDSLIHGLVNDEKYRPFKTLGEIKDTYEDMIMTHMNGAQGVFGSAGPRPPVHVSQAPAKGAEIARFDPPVRGSLPNGRMYVTVYDPAQYSLPQMRRTALHEGPPGHSLHMHFQYQADLHPYMKTIQHPTYRESFAMYAESYKLAQEMGIPVTVEEKACMAAIRLAIARAVKLDIGVNYFGWSLNEATNQRLKMHGTEGSDISHYDILRVIAWPGQSITYLFGDFFADLRRSAETTLGDSFNVEDFHLAILTGGEMPFDMLRMHIDNWIETVHRGDTYTFN